MNRSSSFSWCRPARADVLQVEPADVSHMYRVVGGMKSVRISPAGVCAFFFFLLLGMCFDILRVWSKYSDADTLPIACNGRAQSANHDLGHEERPQPGTTCWKHPCSAVLVCGYDGTPVKPQSSQDLGTLAAAPGLFTNAQSKFLQRKVLDLQVGSRHDSVLCCNGVLRCPFLLAGVRVRAMDVACLVCPVGKPC